MQMQSVVHSAGVREMDRRETNQKWYYSFDEKRMVIILKEEPEEGEVNEVPAKYEVCGTCNGKGSHVNPSIDSNGLSAEDFAEDRDFEEMYFSGGFDVSCNECKGNKVVPEVNWDSLTQEEKDHVTQIIDDHYAYQMEMAWERKMGW